MKKLQMVDLKSQYNKIKDEVNASIQEVLDNNTYINGPLVHQFQADLEKYLGSCIRYDENPTQIKDYCNT
jgi:dTDP-4-amino-4,6-dideoxygalactose transaminase